MENNWRNFERGNVLRSMKHLIFKGKQAFLIYSLNSYSKGLFSLFDLKSLVSCFPEN